MQYRRGHAGVAAVWDHNLDHLIFPFPDEGNERIMVIGAGNQENLYSIIFISSYLPAGNSTSEFETYREAIDMVYEIILKYRDVSDVVWIGDMNGSLNRTNMCARDNTLRSFCLENGPA